MKSFSGLIAIVLLLSASLVSASENLLVIAHRGASGYRPEHTRAAYELAIAQGADFIEPDLVMTKDKVLIVRHEPEISETTDAAEKFPERKRTIKIDGKNVTGWFASDFTLKEIKTLKAKQRVKTRDQSFNAQFDVLTLEEVISIAKEKSKQEKRTIGIFPELKHATFHRSHGLALEPALAKVLKAHSWGVMESPVIVQSFELESLKELKKLTSTRLVLLINKAGAVDPATLKNVSRTVYGIAPDKQHIMAQGSGDEPVRSPDLVTSAHALGLKVYPYTFRSDGPELAGRYAKDPIKEYQDYFAQGIDGVFSDHPDHAVQAAKAFRAKKSAPQN